MGMVGRSKWAIVAVAVVVVGLSMLSSGWDGGQAHLPLANAPSWSGLEPASGSQYEVSAQYQSTQYAVEKFWQNTSGAAYGQSTEAKFSTALTASFSNVVSVDAVLTLGIPSGILAGRANVTQGTSYLYNYTVPYQAKIYGVVEGNTDLVEHTVALTTPPIGNPPAVGVYTIYVNLTLQIDYVEFATPAWVFEPNGTYELSVSLTAPSTGTLNFSSLAGGAYVSIPFPGPVNTSTLKVLVNNAKVASYQWTTGYVYLVPPDIAASHTDTIKVSVLASPVSSGQIPVLRFSAYYAAGGGYEGASASWYNNRTNPYDGNYLIVGDLPYPINPTTVSITYAGKNLSTNFFAVQGDSITIYPGAVVTNPGFAVAFGIHFAFLNAPPTITILLGTSIFGGLTWGDALLVLEGLIVGYAAVLLTKWGKRQYKTRGEWRDRMFALLVVLSFVAAMYVWGAFGSLL